RRDIPPLSLHDALPILLPFSYGGGTRKLCAPRESVVGYDGTVSAAGQYFGKSALFMDGEDDDRDGVFTRQRDGGDVHDGKALFEHFAVRQTIETGGGRVLLRIGGIDAVDLRALEDRFGAHFGGAQRGGRIGREERVAGTAGEDHHAAGRQVMERCALREALADLRHGYGRKNDGVDFELAQRGSQCQRIDD